MTNNGLVWGERARQVKRTSSSGWWQRLAVLKGWT